MKNKTTQNPIEHQRGKLKALAIFAITQDGQGMKFVLTEDEQLFIADIVSELHGGVIKAIKRDDIELKEPEQK